MKLSGSSLYMFSCPLREVTLYSVRKSLLQVSEKLLYTEVASWKVTLSYKNPPSSPPKPKPAGGMSLPHCLTLKRKATTDFLQS
jgi:hypothetical protein